MYSGSWCSGNTRRFDRRDLGSTPRDLVAIDLQVKSKLRITIRIRDSRNLFHFHYIKGVKYG